MKFFKIVLFTLLFIGLCLFLPVRYFQWSIKPIIGEESTQSLQFSATSIIETPIVHSAMHPKLIAEAESYGYTNINGPSLIKVPDWIENKLGAYYLYFAHHKGPYIRLAYADTLTGPWTMYEGEILPLAKAGLATASKPALGVIKLKQHLKWTEFFALLDIGTKAKKAYETRTKQKLKSSPPTTPHVASPEILIDEVEKKIRLYYHGVKEGNLQMSKVALSADGLHFSPLDGIISVPYLRVFPYRNQYYGLAMPGFLYRSKDGLRDFEVRKRWLFDTNVRHSSVYLQGTMLYVFFTKVGDAPEQIYYSSVDISAEDWNDWQASPPKVLLKPTKAWEGANEPILPSMRGEMSTLVNQLRDPAIFEENGELYLLYTGGGEQAIGIAKLAIE